MAPGGQTSLEVAHCRQRKWDSEGLMPGGQWLPPQESHQV